MPRKAGNTGKSVGSDEQSEAVAPDSSFLARDATWLVLGRVARMAAAFLTPVILTRHLTKADYGAFRQIDLVAAMIGALAVLGLERAVTNFVPRPEHDASEEASTAFWAVLGLSVLVLGPFLLFPQGLEALFSLRHLYALVVAIVMTSVAEALVAVVRRALIAAGQGKTAALVIAALNLPYVVSLAVAVWCGGGLRAICLVVGGNGLLTCAILGAILYRRGLLRAKFDRRILARQLRFSLPLWAIGLVSVFGSRVDRLLIMSGMDEGTFAVYSTGLAGLPVISILATSVRDVTAPRFAQYDSTGERSKAAHLWKKGSELLLPVHLFAAGMQLSLAHLLVPLLYTTEFIAAVPVFRVSAAMTLILAFAGMELVARAMSAFRFLAMVTVGMLLLRVLAGLAVLPLQSLALQAATQIAVSYLQIATYMGYIRRQLGVSWRDLLPTTGVIIEGLAPVVLCALAGFFIERAMGDASLLARAAVVSCAWVPGGLVVGSKLLRERRRLT